MYGRALSLAAPLAAILAAAAAPARANPTDAGTGAQEQDEPKETSGPDAEAAPPGASAGEAPPDAREDGGSAGRDDDAARGSWIDASHAFVGETLLAPVMRFDRFFSDERELEAERARSFVRLRGEVRFEYEEDPRFATSFRANLRFPGVNRALLRRLRLVIEGETDELSPAEIPPGEGDDLPPERVRSGDAELRLRLWDTLLAHADVGAGLLFELPPGGFGRLRLRWAIPLGARFLTRFALVGFYRTDERFGAQTDLQLERPLAPRVLARISGRTRVSEESPGVEWRSELAAFVSFGERAAGAFGVGAGGATRLEPVELEAVHLFARLRRDVHRRWLFVELAPELFWPHTPERGRHTSWAVTTRLEVQFHGRPRPPDPEEPEPPDTAPDPPAPEGSIPGRGER